MTNTGGQNVGVMLSGTTNNSNHWILEIYGGGQWQNLSKDSQININNLVVNQRIDIRVRPNPSQLPTAQMTYLLNFGSAVVLDSHNVSGESNVIRIPYSAPTQYGYMTTQAYRQLTWSARATDSKGTPIPDLSAILYLDSRADSEGTLNFTQYTQQTGGAGTASGLINLGTCAGDWRTEFVDYNLGYRNTWRTDYNAGGWHLKFAESPTVGVGGPNVPYVTFGHLCNQTLISSDPT